MSSPSTRGGAALLLLAASAVLGELAVDCDPALCKLPDCSCSSTATPGGLSPVDIPHFVVLTFDDAVTGTAFPFFQALQEFKNPDGCGIKMTFFISHMNTDYTLVNDLYRNGHEIAVHSVTHKSDVYNYWRTLTKEGWLAEIEQQKQMLEIYGKIPGSAIEGFRAPFLEVGGNEMYGALQEAGFRYDSSWPSLTYTPWLVQPDGSVRGALWPYTLDYASVQDQTVGMKPTDSFPGMWVSPMTDMQDDRGYECAMLDACQSVESELETSAAAVADLLKRNYESHTAAKTPYGIYVHSAWFYNEVRREGLKIFLSYLSTLPEAYVVSVRQLLDWTQSPVPLSQLGSHPSFQCSDPLPNTDCVKTDNVNCFYHEPLPFPSYEVGVKICQRPCPANYPYLNNVNGTESYPLGGV